MESQEGLAKLPRSPSRGFMLPRSVSSRSLKDKDNQHQHRDTAAMSPCEVVFDVKSQGGSRRNMMALAHLRSHSRTDLGTAWASSGSDSSGGEDEDDTQGNGEYGRGLSSRLGSSTDLTWTHGPMPSHITRLAHRLRQGRPMSVDTDLGKENELLANNTMMVVTSSPSVSSPSSSGALVNRRVQSLQSLGRSKSLTKSGINRCPPASCTSLADNLWHDHHGQASSSVTTACRSPCASLTEGSLAQPHHALTSQTLSDFSNAHMTPPSSTATPEARPQHQRPHHRRTLSNQSNPSEIRPPHHNTNNMNSNRPLSAQSRLDTFSSSQSHLPASPHTNIDNDNTSPHSHPGRHHTTSQGHLISSPTSPQHNHHHRSPHARPLDPPSPTTPSSKSTPTGLPSPSVIRISPLPRPPSASDLQHRPSTRLDGISPLLPRPPSLSDLQQRSPTTPSLAKLGGGISPRLQTSVSFSALQQQRPPNLVSSTKLDGLSPRVHTSTPSSHDPSLAKLGGVSPRLHTSPSCSDLQSTTSTFSPRFHTSPSFSDLQQRTSTPTLTNLGGVSPRFHTSASFSDLQQRTSTSPLTTKLNGMSLSPRPHHMPPSSINESIDLNGPPVAVLPAGESRFPMVPTGAAFLLSRSGSGVRTMSSTMCS